MPGFSYSCSEMMNRRAITTAIMTRRVQRVLSIERGRGGSLEAGPIVWHVVASVEHLERSRAVVRYDHFGKISATAITLLLLTTGISDNATTRAGLGYRVDQDGFDYAKVTPK
jgi:hypothetical protein